MKTIIKATLSTIVAVLFGVFFMYAFNIYSGQDLVTTIENKFLEIELEAKQMFLEKPDSIQLTALGLLNKDGISILRSREGTPYIETENGPIPLTGMVKNETEEYIENVMDEYQNNGIICNIKVTSDSIIFFTNYNQYGCVGFLYEKELGNTKNYNTIEIVENWNVFHYMDIK